MEKEFFKLSSEKQRFFESLLMAQKATFPKETLREQQLLYCLFFLQNSQFTRKLKVDLKAVALLF